MASTRNDKFWKPVKVLSSIRDLKGWQKRNYNNKFLHKLHIILTWSFFSVFLEPVNEPAKFHQK